MLHRLSEECRKRSLTVGELKEALGTRGFAAMLLLVALPFCIPVAIPGVSVPFGIVVLLTGWSLALGRTPWIPRRMAAAHFPQKLMSRVLEFTSWLLGWMEKWTRPRLGVLIHWKGAQRFFGIVIAFCGFLLMLPPPMINLIPAACIVLLALGWIRRDGLVLAAGYILMGLAFAGTVWLGFYVARLSAEKDWWDAIRGVFDF